MACLNALPNCHHHEAASVNQLTPSERTNQPTRHHPPHCPRQVYYTGDADEGDLEEAEGILLEQRDKFSKNSNAFNVIPYQAFIELDDISAAFLIRQYFHHNLHDALLHHHPPFTFEQKLFIVYVRYRVFGKHQQQRWLVCFVRSVVWSTVGRPASLLFVVV